MTQVQYKSNDTGPTLVHILPRAEESHSAHTPYDPPETSQIFHRGRFCKVLSCAEHVALGLVC